MNKIKNNKKIDKKLPKWLNIIREICNLESPPYIWLTDQWGVLIVISTSNLYFPLTVTQL